MSEPKPKRVRHSKTTGDNETSPSQEILRPNTQGQSRFLTLPPEIIDKILGDDVLNEREHVALSGTCTALRLGYDETVWVTMTRKAPASHNTFSYALLKSPCNAAEGTTILDESSPAPPKSRIWSRALRTDVRAGIDFQGPCYKARHMKCQCMRLHGPNHSAVISNVNIHKTSWGQILFHYQGLSEYVDKRKFTTVDRIGSGGLPSQRYRLAAVDAAILRAVGGVVGAQKVRKSEEGQKRKTMPRVKKPKPIQVKWFFPEPPEWWLKGLSRPEDVGS